MPEQSPDSAENLIPAENWQVYPPKQKDDGWGIYVEGTGRLEDFCIAKTLTDYDPQVEEAHAKLLAAAPELANALQVALKAGIIDDFGSPSSIELARDALKKAGRLSNA